MLSGDVSEAQISEIVLQKGNQGSLSCELERSTDGLNWFKGSSLLFSYILKDDVWRKIEDNDIEGLYNIYINSSFTVLIINDVEIETEDIYSCQLFLADSGTIVTKETQVYVFGECKNSLLVVLIQIRMLTKIII